MSVWVWAFFSSLNISSLFVFSNLSFGELSRCQRAFNSFLICREHLVDAARRQSESRKYGFLQQERMTPPPFTSPAASTATYFFTGILPSLLVCRETRTYLRSNTCGLSHTWVNDFACVQSATIEAVTDGCSLTFSPGRLVCTCCFWQHCKQVPEWHWPSSNVRSGRNTNKDVKHQIWFVSKSA